MTKTIYTIGYSGFKLDDFAQVLEDYHIHAVIDVRSIPFSDYYTSYDRPELEAFLKSKGKHYRNYAKEFGARRTDRELYSPEGWLDFEKVAASENFRKGVRKLCAGMDKGYSFVLMCAEKYPVNCHRAILVARAFHELGCNVLHIMPDGNNINQKELEDYMITHMKLQQDMFTTRKDIVRQAYRLQNIKIGWRLDSDREGE